MIGRIRKAWLRTGLRLPFAAYATLFVITIVNVALKALARHFAAEQFDVFALALIALVSVIFGAWRGIGNHPAQNSKYRQWLKSIPWNWTKPLPLGPAWATWEDAVVIGVLALLWNCPIHADIWPGTPVLLYMASGAVGAAVIFLMVGQLRHCFALCIALGGLIYLTPTQDWNLILALTAVVYLLANWGLKRSMRSFPWEAESVTIGEEAGHYRLLSGKDPGEHRYFLFSVPIGVLLGWLVYVAVHTVRSFEVDFQRDPALLLGFFYMLFSFVCTVACMNQYFGSKRAPMGWWARLINGYGSFPQYDRIVFVSLAGLMGSLALPFVLFALKTPLEINAGVCVAVQISFYALTPSPRRFSLTGEYQLVLEKGSQVDSYVRETAQSRSPGLKGRLENFSAALNKKVVVLTRPDANAIRRRGKIEATCCRVLPKVGLWGTVGVFGAITVFTTVAPPLGAFFACMLGMVYGMHRVMNFHPAFHPQYRGWLMSGPWNPRKPLPFGPVELVWQDLIAIAAMTVWVLYAYALYQIVVPETTIPTHYLLYIVPGVFLICSLFYAFKAMSILWMIGRPDACCLMLMLVGVPLLRPNVFTAAAMMIIVALIAGRQLCDSLNDMPWPNSLLAIRESHPRARLVNYILLDRASLGSAIGPRQHYLSPKLDLIVPGARIKILLSTLIGWWVFLPARLLIVNLNPMRPPQFQILFKGFLFMFVCWVVAVLLARIACYYLWGGMPMSGFGRLFTLRWIIWRYDKPALISFAIAAGSIAIPFALNAAGLPLHFTFGISFAAATAMSLLVGPSIRTWLLTGGHREPGKLDKTLFARFS